MPTAKELGLKFGDVVGMNMFGCPKRYSEYAIGLSVEYVKVQIMDVTESGTAKVMYLEDSKLAGAQRGDIHTVKNQQYSGFYRLDNQSSM